MQSGQKRGGESGKRVESDPTFTLKTRDGSDGLTHRDSLTSSMGLEDREGLKGIEGLEGREISLIRRAGNKNMYLRVKPPLGRIVVTAPLRASEDSIREFISLHRAWIDKQMALFHQAQTHDPSRGDDCGFAGEPYPCLLPVSQWDSEEKETARQRLSPIIDYYLTAYTALLGRAPSTVTLRLMTSRWGSCTPTTGRIRFNLALSALPNDLIEYVVVHELTHLYEKGHGEGFRGRMNRYLPDWRRRRRELNRCILY